MICLIPRDISTAKHSASVSNGRERRFPSQWIFLCCACVCVWGSDVMQASDASKTVANSGNTVFMYR